MQKHPIEIEDVKEPFCGQRRENTVPLSDARPDIAAQWLYSMNAGWGPESFSRASSVKCWWQCMDCKGEYKAKIAYRTSKTPIGCPYCVKRARSENSLARRHPKVAAEWHPKKNNNLKPSDIGYGSLKKVWWRCKACKHEWACQVSSRTLRGSGCAACNEARKRYLRTHPETTARKRLSKRWYARNDHDDKFVSLVRSHRRIAKEWHPTKNGDWMPADFSEGSQAIAWWKCKKGADHEWKARIFSRALAKHGCPYCAGQKVSITNCLQTIFPRIAKEWHPKKNGKLRPTEITWRSSKRVWWRCSRYDHQWRARIVDRTRHGSGCRSCANQRLRAQNCLTAKYPRLAAQFHPTKNGSLKPSQVVCSSKKKVWWFCRKGSDHVWQATPANRTQDGSGCPFCAGKRASSTNSVASLYPKIAKQWDKTKNGKLTPSDVTVGTLRKVWWRCKNGHSWQQSVNRRTRATIECWHCRSGRPR